MPRYYTYPLERSARRDAAIRAADDDRERVAGRLRASHVEGRLDLAEFQQRLDLCYEAKTMGQLAELVRDLPRRRERDDAGWAAWLGRRRWLVAAAALVLSLMVVASATGHASHQGGWVWIPLFFIFWRFAPWRRRRGRYGPPPNGPGGI
ncbi:MAG TPA: DUF1707 domain-containing protein [Solirubrobacteraceae bacterium]|nr:DUF1707 domain-containing protein [Solirubrobacteraceae bacterium]